MELETYSEVKKVAAEKWREYNDAAKKSNNPVYKDLKKAYYHIKGGKKIIDIGKVIAKGGVHENFHPKLAIAKASAKMVYCSYEASGKVYYKHEQWRFSKVSDIVINDALPTIPRSFFERDWLDRLQLQAPIPLIPPKYLPENLTEDYYILWEVDEWKMVPPTDPVLLKRITNNFFVVLAAWDLTPLEKAAMAGRMF